MDNDTMQAYGKLSSLFYDATELYASDQEVSFFVSCIQKNPGRVLEAMSGSGRLQIPLIQRGYIVDGVDYSDAMLSRCRKRCEKLGINPDLYQQSLEHLSLPHAYSSVIIAVASLQLITDQAMVSKALKNLHAHMLPDANLFIDTFIPDVTMNDFAVSMVRLNEHTSIRLTKRHHFDLTQKIARSFGLYELIIDGIVQQQENELIELVWRSDDEWRELLRKAGFEIVSISDEICRKSEPSRIIHAKKLT